MRKLILLLAILIPAGAMAQEIGEHKRNRGILKDDNGTVIGRVNPTPQFALDAKQAGKVWAQRAARVVLRQLHQPRSAAELDASADELERVMLESYWHMRTRATFYADLTLNTVNFVGNS